MAPPRFKQENKEILDSLLSGKWEVESGKAFGLPAYYVNGKMFACVYEEGVAIKVPEKLVGELIEKPEISRFEPMGRHKMKQWVLITRGEPEGYLEDMDLFRTSIDYVHELSAGKGTR